MYGIACVLTFLLVAWAHRNDKPNHADAMGAASLLCVSYGVTNLAIALYGWPNAVLTFPALDAFLAFMVWRAWARRPRIWKAILLSCLVAQMVLHVAFIATWQMGEATMGTLYTYAVLINVIFLMELSAVAFPGARHAVDRVRARLSELGAAPSVEGG